MFRRDSTRLCSVKRHRVKTELWKEDHTMRNETANLVEEIKQAIDLLRGFL